MTPNPDTDLSEILRRVEAATDQDRELDVAIHEALCERMYETIIKRGGDYCLRYYPGPPEPEYYKLPRYTASLDAAISLVERLDLKWWILRRGHVTAYHCEIRVYNGGAEYQAFHGQSRTAPLAVLSALFHALLERTKHA